MTAIRNVKLELLRAGPAHNQLLSPLTPYYAVCGTEGVVTVNFPFEHRQLLHRLARLRYVTAAGEIPAPQREAEIRELGELIGQVFGQIPTLVSELANAGGAEGLVHLRLSMSAYELALIPYELAIGANGFPASGSPLFLQSRLPITFTREVRHGQPLPVNWNRPPRILFAYANPDGFVPVPVHDHLNALRRAIDPWIAWRPDPVKRIGLVKDMLTVIPDATLEKIRNACLDHEFTHIHILAHGSPFEEAGEQHFGLALCSEAYANKADIVDGERLSIALAANDSANCLACRPTLVSLATCDSGAVNSVLTPTGSIAHALHAGGIPWVIASQFPLWMRASSLAVETLYTDILAGEDPRCVLYKLRQRLRTDVAGTHDWASIVAYATVPGDFDRQVSAFRDRQTRKKMDVKFDIADEYVKSPGAAKLPDEYASLDMLYRSIREEHDKWWETLPAGASPRQRSEVLGMRAAAEKRIGLLAKVEAHNNAGDPLASEQKLKCSTDAFLQSRDYYKRALDSDPSYHWVITQYLSMLAVVSPETQYESLADDFGAFWGAARQIAVWNLAAAAGADKAWTLGTLAELELLGVVFDPAHFDLKRAKQEIKRLCRELVSSASLNPFPIFSTRRQFERYAKPEFWQKERWKKLADAALEVLPEQNGNQG